jgi:hypothetical protein
MGWLIHVTAWERVSHGETIPLRVRARGDSGGLQRRTSLTGHRTTITGCVGVLCLAVYWAAMFFPQVANILPESSFGKFVAFGVFLAGVPLTVIAAARVQSGGGSLSPLPPLLCGTFTSASAGS